MQRAFEEGESAAAQESSDREEEIEEFEYDPEKEVELEFELISHTSLEVHRSDVRAVRAFRNAIPYLKHADPEKLTVLVINPNFNVAITRALQKGGKNAEYSFLTESKAEARLFSAKSGLSDVRKGDVTEEKPNKQYKIVFFTDESVEPNWKLDRGVEPGGYLVLPISKAGETRPHFKFLGIIDKKNASNPTVRPKDYEYWRDFEVRNDEEFKEVEVLDKDWIVSYEDAEEQVVKILGKVETNVFDDYTDLLNRAKDTKEGTRAILIGARAIPYTFERDGKPQEIFLKSTLPFRKNLPPSENLAIFKKRETV